MTEAQKCLYHIAENMRMDKSISKEEYEYFQQAIEALEEKPKTGHWIMTSDYLTTAYGSVDYVKCSYCGEDSLEEGDYCPNCGAKMESEE